MCFQEKPILSIAPGPKFSTNTSAFRISFSRISLPSGVLVFSARDLLLLLSWVKYSASTSGMSRNCRRVISPPSTRSTFSTSAPNQANNCVHAGPACTPVKSIIVIPSRGKLMVKFSLFFCQVPRYKSKQLPTCTRLLKHQRCQTQNSRALVDAIAVGNSARERTWSGKSTFYLHRQELSVDSLPGEFPSLEILHRRLFARRLMDRGGARSTRYCVTALYFLSLYLM